MDITETNLTVPEDISSISSYVNSGFVSIDQGYGLSDCCATVPSVKTIPGKATIVLPLAGYFNQTGMSNNEIISNCVRNLKETVANEIALELLKTDAIEFTDPSVIADPSRPDSMTIVMSGTVKVLKN